MVWRLPLLDNPSRNTRRKHGAKEELQVMTGQQCRSPHVLKREQPPRECDSIRVWAFLPVSRPGAARRRREATGLEGGGAERGRGGRAPAGGRRAVCGRIGGRSRLRAWSSPDVRLDRACVWRARAQEILDACSLAARDAQGGGVAEGRRD